MATEIRDHVTIREWIDAIPDELAEGALFDGVHRCAVGVLLHVAGYSDSELEDIQIYDDDDTEGWAHKAAALVGWDVDRIIQCTLHNDATVYRSKDRADAIRAYLRSCMED